MSLQDTSAEDILQGHLPSQSGSSSTPGHKPHQFDSNDLFIAVMGVTGSGKSTFIARCTGQDVAVGHSLKSHTSEIQVYSYKYNDKRIHLIDTPGFDDTYKPDIEVLQTAATWLSDAYQKELRLTGIIYLHRISDTRMGGTAKKDLLMFKKLCGEDSFSSVVLATTFWEKVSIEDGDRREAELRTSTEFYGTMIRHRAHMMRHMDNTPSARAVVAYLVNQNTTTVLNIQREMVADKVRLKETEAGQVLQSDIIRRTEQLNRTLQDLQQKEQEALIANNASLAKEYAEQAEEMEALKGAAQEGAAALDARMEDLFREKDEKLKLSLKQMEDERKERDRILEEKTKAHELFKAKVKEAEELAEAKRKSTEEEIDKTKRELDQSTDDNYRLLSAFIQTLNEAEEEDRKRREENLAKAREELERQKAEIMAAQIKMQQTLTQQAHRPDFYQGYQNDPPPYQMYSSPPPQQWAAAQQQMPQQMYQPPQQQGVDPAIVGMGVMSGIAMASVCTLM